MKAVARSLVVILIALIAVPALAVSVTLTTAVQLLATTVLIMGGTQHSLGPGDDQAYVNDYMGWAVDHFIDTDANTHPDPGDYDTYAVTYTAEFFPVTGTTTFGSSVDQGVGNLGACLDQAPSCNYAQHAPNDPPAPSEAGQPPFVVFGYSQSAVVASLVKNDLITNPDPDLVGTQFFLISNPMRPNGGILSQGPQGLEIPIVGIPFYGPTQNGCGTDGDCDDPGDVRYDTVDVAQEYDILGGDSPVRPLNFLALTNSIMAYALLHGNVPAATDLDTTELIDQGQYGDTHYYLIPTPTVPILLPLVNAGVPAPALAVPNEILKVWINDAYDRGTSPGQRVAWSISPVGNPISVIGNTLGAIPVGIDTTIEGFTSPGNRPLGTQPSGPYGVGGPPVDIVNGPSMTLARTGEPDPAVVEGQTPTPSDNNKKLAVVPDASELSNGEAAEGSETPEATKPKGPFAQLRESLDANKGNGLFGLRPNGEGPLKRIVNALTGQKPKSEAAPEADKKPAESEAPAA